MGTLYLTRSPGQSFRLGKDIVISVDQVKGKLVRLAINAPRHVPIVRSELPVADPALADLDEFLPDGERSVPAPAPAAPPKTPLTISLDAP